MALLKRYELEYCEQDEIYTEWPVKRGCIRICCCGVSDALDVHPHRNTKGIIIEVYDKPEVMAVEAEFEARYSLLHQGPELWITFGDHTIAELGLDDSAAARISRELFNWEIMGDSFLRKRTCYIYVETFQYRREYV